MRYLLRAKQEPHSLWRNAREGKSLSSFLFRLPISTNFGWHKLTNSSMTKFSSIFDNVRVINKINVHNNCVYGWAINVEKIVVYNFAFVARVRVRLLLRSYLPFFPKYCVIFHLIIRLQYRVMNLMRVLKEIFFSFFSSFKRLLCVHNQAIN